MQVYEELLWPSILHLKQVKASPEECPLGSEQQLLLLEPAESSALSGQVANRGKNPRWDHKSDEIQLQWKSLHQRMGTQAEKFVQNFHWKS